MILLEYQCAIIRRILQRSLDENEHMSEEYKCNDFDGVRYKLSHPPAPPKKKQKDMTPEEIQEHRHREITWIINMYMECYQAIAEYGAEDHFRAVYGDMVTEPEPGYTLAIVVDLYACPEEKREELITLASCFKANVMAGPFRWVQQKFNAHENFSSFEIPYRPRTNESIYITPSDNGAIATFSIRFSDPGDRIIGGVFFTELLAARVKIQSAPVIKFSPTPPGELDGFNIPDEYRNEKMFAFVSIDLLAPQLSDRKIQEVSYQVPLFRDYLHYHIKCSKAFLHLKMRSRSALMLQILDKAKPEPKEKKMRTVSGKVIR